MRLWIDDVRPAPEGYIWAKSVNEAKTIISQYVKFIRSLFFSNTYDSKLIAHLINFLRENDVLDIDHDAGGFAGDGGDYIKLLDWLEEKEYYFPIHIHSQNPVGAENMRRIIRRNGWKEV